MNKKHISIRFKLVSATLSLVIILSSAAEAAPPNVNLDYQTQAKKATATFVGKQTPAFRTSAAQLTTEQFQRMKAWEKRSLGDRPLSPSGLAPVAPSADSETRDPGIQPNAPSDFLIFRDRSLVPPVLGGVISNINEPSLANSGKFIWYTGNWYAARSIDAGVTWTYINPFTDMPDFCCDQDVVYDKGRDMILWYRQGISNVAPAAPNNRIFLGASTDGGATWCTYDLRPSNYGFGGTDWFDYPHLAVSDDYLYISSNMFNTADVFQRNVISKISLDQLKTCAVNNLTFSFWADASVGAQTPIQGATDTMYLGAHINNTTFKICWNQEGDGILNCTNKSVDTWTLTSKGNAHCPTPDGNDPCQRLDSRVNAGWIKRNGRENGSAGQEHNDSVGFFWTVKEGSGFPFPYVNAAVFDAKTLNYIARPMLWSNTIAFFYAGAAPNARGDLGIASYAAGGGFNITPLVGIDDDINGVPPAWEISYLAPSSEGPDDNKWGDYLRVRPHSPDGLTWIASTHTLQGGGTGSFVKPRYIVFGRERDEAGLKRFWAK